MKKGLIVVAILALVVTMAAVACCPPSGLPTLPSGYVWYHNYHFDYSVGYPADWTIWGETDHYEVQIGDDVTAANLYAGVESLPSGTSLEEYVIDGKDQLVMIGATILSEGPIVVNDRAGYELILTLAMGELRAKERFAIFVVGDIAYVLVCSASEDEYGTYENTFDNIINSFVIR